jgi:hypothetical protein
MPFNTKQEILSYLNTKDKQTLDRLVKYADLLLIPEEDLLINATMQDMLDKVFTLADQYFPEWTDRSHSDFGRFLAELFCLFSEKDFYYANLFTSEAFLHKTNVYSNAYFKSVVLGRIPLLFQSASCVVQLEFQAGAEVYIEPGQIVLATTTNKEFSNSEAFLVPQSLANITINARFHFGKYKTELSQFNGRSVRIVQPEIDLNSMSLQVNNVQWFKQVTFAESTATDTIYVALPEADASVDVLFGDNQFGLRPAVGSDIKVKYRVGGGVSSNTPISTLSINVFPAGRNLVTATMLTAATGGQDQESLSSIKANAPLYFRTVNRVVNPADAVAILNQKPEIYQSYAYNWALTLYIYAIPSTGVPATTQELQLLADEIQQIAVMGYQVLPVATTYIDLGLLEITVFLLSGYNLTEKETEVRQLVLDYTNPIKLSEYSKDFVFSDFADFLKSNILGITNVDVNTVQGLPNSSFPGGLVSVNPTDIIGLIDSTGAITVTTDTGLAVDNLTFSQGDLNITVRYAS